MKHLACLLACTLLLASCEPELPEMTIFMAGDSTMSIKPDSTHPERGWGMLLPEFFDPALVEVENYAKNGRSTRSFLAEGLWKKITDKAQPGDWVIIQFGHNDTKKDSLRFSTLAQYRENLLTMASEAIALQAHPMLCTPIMRRRFDEQGEFYDTHGAYPEVVRSLADSMQIPMVDMHRLSEKLIVDHGEQGSMKLFLHYPPGVIPAEPEGLEDNTHFSEYGAREMARLFVEDVRRQNLELAQYLKDE